MLRPGNPAKNTTYSSCMSCDKSLCEQNSSLKTIKFAMYKCVKTIFYSLEMKNLSCCAF